MENKQKKPFVSDAIFPPVPENYYSRMEAVLDDLPIKERSVTIGGFTKRQFIILVAALVMLLVASTAVAVGLSQMQSIRDKGLEKLDDYTGFIQGTVLPSDAAPTDAEDSDFVAYVPLGVGMQDDEGIWQPIDLGELDESASIGTITFRLRDIHYHAAGNSPIMVSYRVESDPADRYQFAPFYLSINGGEPIQDSSSLARVLQSAVTPTPAPFEYPYADDREPTEDGRMIDTDTLYFKVGENPFRPDTKFTFTSELNGVPFSITYVLTNERFEALRQKHLDALNNYADLLKLIPENPISVGAEFAGYRVDEIARVDHWLYYTFSGVDAYWEAHPMGREPIAGKYDEGGFYPVLDGMVCPEFEFISSTQDAEGYAIEQLCRVWLPYGDTLPKESLLLIEGAPFRIEWETNKVTLPKDEAETLAWRQESDRMSAENGEYDADWIAKPNAKAATFTLTDLIYMNNVGMRGQIGVIFETDTAVKNPFDSKERQPVITIGGFPLESITEDYEALDSFCGGTANRGRRVGFCFYGAALRTLPDTFNVTVSWNGSETTFTLHKSDLISRYEKDGDWEQFGKDYAKVLGI